MCTFIFLQNNNKVYIFIYLHKLFCMALYSYIKMFSNFKQFRYCKSSDDVERLQTTAGFVEGGSVFV